MRLSDRMTLWDRAHQHLKRAASPRTFGVVGYAAIAGLSCAALSLQAVATVSVFPKICKCSPSSMARTISATRNPFRQLRPRFRSPHFGKP
jgi:hypothetical protein